MNEDYTLLPVRKIAGDRFAEIVFEEKGVETARETLEIEDATLARLELGGLIDAMIERPHDTVTAARALTVACFYEEFFKPRRCSKGKSRAIKDGFYHAAHIFIDNFDEEKCTAVLHKASYVFNEDRILSLE